ncbi:hypothetical protein BC941DRAFT_477333 [Chlamydoabsidia padenii]|nr:hypothetical protein BC941DRAFT_477333 [Chlamydoabsidia padenii]
MTFDTMDEARIYYKKVSKQQKFLTVTIDSKDDERRNEDLYLRWHKKKARRRNEETGTQCGWDAIARFVFIEQKNSTVWKLTSLNDQHCNHPMANQFSRYASHQKATPDQYDTILQMICTNCTNQQIVQALNTHNENCPPNCENHGAFIDRDITNMCQNFAGVPLSVGLTVQSFINNMESRGYTFRLRCNNVLISAQHEQSKMITMKPPPVLTKKGGAEQKWDFLTFSKLIVSSKVKGVFNPSVDVKKMMLDTLVDGKAFYQDNNVFGNYGKIKEVLAADAFHRPIEEHTRHELSLFLPLANITYTPYKPVILQLHGSHFYLVTLKVGKRNFPKIYPIYSRVCADAGITD